jgi:hypothetical protein
MDKNLLLGVLIGILVTLVFTAFLGVATYANMMGWNNGKAMHNGDHMHDMNDHMQQMHDECEEMMHEHGNYTEHMS